MNQTQATPSPSIPSFIQTNIPLKDKNWFKTGGSAKFYCEPSNPEELKSAYQFAQSSQEEIFILGSGANILISDDGFDGLVIKPMLNTIEMVRHVVNTPAHHERISSKTHTLVKAGTGTTMDALIEYCLSNNLLGLEEFSGIPGTVGGSVFINLHYFEFLLSQFLVSATLMEKETNSLLTVDNTWFNFGYNTSTLHRGKHFLVDATFKLENASELQTSHARGRSEEIIRHRAKRYPTKNTCGSFFRNFHEDEVTLIENGKKVIWVAYYLDKVGVKGQLANGDASVSYQHANMIINQGNATTVDIIAVARSMQEHVEKEFGIIPQPECRLIGFKAYPLLKNKADLSFSNK